MAGLSVVIWGTMNVSVWLNQVPGGMWGGRRGYEQ